MYKKKKKQCRIRWLRNYNSIFLATWDFWYGNGEILEWYQEETTTTDRRIVSNVRYEIFLCSRGLLHTDHTQILNCICDWNIFLENSKKISTLFQAYVSCALGIPSVGYVMICFGVVNAVCSLLFGTIMKYIGRLPLMVLGFVVHSILIWILIVWRPHPNNPKLFFTISGLWGVGDAVWQTQMSGESNGKYVFNFI